MRERNYIILHYITSELTDLTHLLHSCIKITYNDWQVFQKCFSFNSFLGLSFSVLLNVKVSLMPECSYCVIVNDFSSGSTHKPLMIIIINRFQKHNVSVHVQLCWRRMYYVGRVDESQWSGIDPHICLHTQTALSVLRTHMTSWSQTHKHRSLSVSETQTKHRDLTLMQNPRAASQTETEPGATDIIAAKGF